MSTFAYEYYKRNRAILRLGGVKDAGQRLIQIGDNKYTTIFDTGIVDTIVGLFENAPQFDFTQNYGDSHSLLVEALTQLGNTVQAVGAGYNSLPGNNLGDKVMNLYNGGGKEGR